jgi:mannose-6-phosphate isomerase-like protein (cupin superfamily)
MKAFSRCLSVAAAAIALTARVGAQHGGVVHLPAEKVSPLLEKGGSVATLPDASVSINRRTGPGQSEIHDKETDTFYILDGDATFVTGGKVVGGKTTAPGQIRGTGIEGGQTMQLHKGDVVVIPAGTPHWFKEVPTKVVYYTVKAIRP